MVSLLPATKELDKASLLLPRNCKTILKFLAATQLGIALHGIILFSFFFARVFEYSLDGSTAVYTVFCKGHVIVNRQLHFIGCLLSAPAGCCTLQATSSRDFRTQTDRMEMNIIIHNVWESLHVL